MRVFIGRQPIYNNIMEIEGYSLSYRHGTGSTSAALFSGDDSIVCSVLMTAVFGFERGRLTDGKAAYISSTNNLITEELFGLYPPDRFIIEVPPNVFLNDKIYEHLSMLYYKGYKLSLRSYNNSIEKSRSYRQLGVFDVVRLDLTNFNRMTLQSALRNVRNYHARLLAENIDSEAKLRAALALGFDLFEGSYFGEPECITREVSLRDFPYGQLFNALLNDYDNREILYNIIMSDPALTHMFLRKTFNSRHNRQAAHTEVERGLNKISETELRHWASVILLDQACTDSPKELVPDAHRRGLIMEHLAEKVNLGVKPGKAFMFGIASSLDRILNEPMEAVIPQLDLDEEMEDALTRRSCENGYATLLKGAIACEADPKSPALPSAFSRLGKEDISRLLWKCRVNTEYITLAIGFTVPSSSAATYKGNVLQSELEKQYKEIKKLFEQK